MTFVSEVLTPGSLEAKRRQRVAGVVSEDRISALPDDLIVEILSLVPIKYVLATMILSKRWRSMWTLVPKFEYKESSNDPKSESLWRFLDKTLELHKAPVLETLSIRLDRKCPIDVDLGKWIANAVDRYVHVVEFELLRSTNLTNLPKSLYTCKTLVELTLSHKILVDVPSSACLPSLKKLYLFFVVYKDQDSLVRLLSSCSVLARSRICLDITNDREDSRLIELARHVAVPNILICCNANDKILRSLSSVTNLMLPLSNPMPLNLNGITFSRLGWVFLCINSPGWSDLLFLILNNSPKLKFLGINFDIGDQRRNLPLLWNQPNSVPRCLSSFLEIFDCGAYGGSGEERKFMAYILANTKCLKKTKIYIRSNFNLEDKPKMVEELKSMSRVSTTCELLIK